MPNITHPARLFGAGLPNSRASTPQPQIPSDSITVEPETSVAFKRERCRTNSNSSSLNSHMEMEIINHDLEEICHKLWNFSETLHTKKYNVKNFIEKLIVLLENNKPDKKNYSISRKFIKSLAEYNQLAIKSDDNNQETDQKLEKFLKFIATDIQKGIKKYFYQSTGFDYIFNLEIKEIIEERGKEEGGRDFPYYNYILEENHNLIDLITAISKSKKDIEDIKNIKSIINNSITAHRKVFELQFPEEPTTKVFTLILEAFYAFMVVLSGVALAINPTLHFTCSMAILAFGTLLFISKILHALKLLFFRIKDKEKKEAIKKFEALKDGMADDLNAEAIDEKIESIEKELKRLKLHMLGRSEQRAIIVEHSNIYHQPAAQQALPTRIQEEILFFQPSNQIEHHNFQPVSQQGHFIQMSRSQYMNTIA